MVGCSSCFKTGPVRRGDGYAKARHPGMQRMRLLLRRTCLLLGGLESRLGSLSAWMGMELGSHQVLPRACSSRSTWPMQAGGALDDKGQVLMPACC